MRKIKAICLDRQEHERMLNSGLSADLEVEPIHKVIKASFPECDYQYIDETGEVKLFERYFKPIESIREDLRWTYYLIDDQVYQSFWTNELSFWEKEAVDFKEPERQLSIFDF